MSQEHRVMKIYNQILKDIMYPLLGNDLTYGNDLERIGKIFVPNFIGVFSSDLIPDLKTGESCIVNLDTSQQNGSHWISVLMHKNIVYVYDSFGRSSREIIKSLFHKFPKQVEIIDSDNDAEQTYEQNDCGQRSLTFIIIFNQWGKNLALLI